MDYIGGTLTGENWKLNCGKMVGNLCQKKCQRAWKWREKEGGVLYFFCIFFAVWRGVSAIKVEN